jgi:hypothetical protein
VELVVKLKVCEACGSLWYRTQGDSSAYCGACEIKLADFPTVESRKRRGRPSKKPQPGILHHLEVRA